MNQKQFQTISALRIYLKRGENKKAASWWGRFTEKPLSTYLVQSALKAGVTHASVNLGHMGFAKDAKAVSYDISEIPVKTLPACVELLAPKRILEQFVQDEAKNLKGTTLVMVEGLHISPHYLAELENAIEKAPHKVEYITGDAERIPVERVTVDERPLNLN